MSTDEAKKIAARQLEELGVASKPKRAEKRRQPSGLATPMWGASVKVIFRRHEVVELMELAFASYRLRECFKDYEEKREVIEKIIDDWCAK